jgi:hypothetical protein
MKCEDWGLNAGDRFQSLSRHSRNRSIFQNTPYLPSYLRHPLPKVEGLNLIGLGWSPTAHAVG